MTKKILFFGLLMLSIHSCMTPTRYESLPTRYEHLINNEQYIIALEHCYKYLDNYGEILDIKDGVIKFDDKTKDYQNFSLDNLVRTLSTEDTAKYKDLIFEHFDKLFNGSENKYNLDDFENIKNILGIRVYPDGYFEEINYVDNVIYRVDFENTKSTIVFDFPEKFQPVEKIYLEKWGKSKDDLFDLAIANVNKQEIEVNKKRFENGFDLYAFFSGDYSVSYLIDFQKNADFAIGKYGALVIIPNRGSAFAHPIDLNDIGLVIGDIHEMINDFYDNDPGPINTNYYWFNKGKFHIFPTDIDKEGYTNHYIPNELSKLFDSGL